MYCHPNNICQLYRCRFVAANLVLVHRLFIVKHPIFGVKKKKVGAAPSNNTVTDLRGT